VFKFFINYFYVLLFYLLIISWDNFKKLIILINLFKSDLKKKKKNYLIYLKIIININNIIKKLRNVKNIKKKMSMIKLYLNKKKFGICRYNHIDIFLINNIF